MNYEELNFDFNRVIVDPRLSETINEITKMGVSLPDVTPNIKYDPGELVFSAAELVIPVGDMDKSKLDARAGQDLSQQGRRICGYDESKGKYVSLEGEAYLTSHSLVQMHPENYLPANYLTFYFYTKAQELAAQSEHIRVTDDLVIASEKDYIRDRIAFLENTVPNNSLLMIDGPLIGGDVYTILIRAMERLNAKNILSVFFVKNSGSNLVTENLPTLRGKFNSDLHWSYRYLNRGERTNFFVYRDRNNEQNAKVFCYLKAFDLGPQRIEFHYETFLKYSSEIDNLMNLVYYLLLVQGDERNPQVRPIAVAELYARETLKLVDIVAMMRKAGVMPSMNQIRFGAS